MNRTILTVSLPLLICMLPQQCWPQDASNIAEIPGIATRTKHTLHIDDEKQWHAAPKPSAQIADLAWLTGSWKGTGLGGECSETWSEPHGGTMVGTFRFVDKGALQFSEFFMLAKIDDHIVLKLKHFDSDFKGWEEKDGSVDFRLIKVQENTAWFDGLTYRRDGDSLHVHVVMKSKEGKLSEAKFEFQRQASK